MSTFVKSEDLDENLTAIVDSLQQGQLVIVPTETVYGLAALATSEAAVAKIFKAKGRPSTNPIIVHCASLEQARSLSGEWDETAERLAEMFWPGPLTIVLPASDVVPSIITAGGPTVGIRIPSNPTFLNILEATGPLAAPSANVSNEISPTKTEHLSPTVLQHVSFVVDDGPCDVGIESTVVRTHPTPVVLRPGGLGLRELRSVHPEFKHHESPESVVASPGLHARHYAPNAPTRVVESFDGVSAEATALVWSGATPNVSVIIPMPDSPKEYARVLFDTLHRVDSDEPASILIEAVPDDEAWRAIADRIRRASSD